MPSKRYVQRFAFGNYVVLKNDEKLRDRTWEHRENEKNKMTTHTKISVQDNRTRITRKFLRMNIEFECVVSYVFAVFESLKRCNFVSLMQKPHKLFVSLLLLLLLLLLLVCYLFFNIYLFVRILYAYMHALL